MHVTTHRRNPVHPSQLWRSVLHLAIFDACNPYDPELSEPARDYLLHDRHSVAVVCALALVDPVIVEELVRILAEREWLLRRPDVRANLRELLDSGEIGV